jgi:hypothetical protein
MPAISFACAELPELRVAADGQRDQGPGINERGAHEAFS